MTSDIRAVAVAVGAWLGAAAGWLHPHQPMVLAVVVVAGVGAAIRVQWARPVTVVLLCAGAVAVLGSDARQLPADVNGRTARLTAEVTGPPRQIDVGLARTPAVGVPVVINAIEVAGRRWAVHLPARLFADAGTIPEGLPEGATVTARARLEPPQPRQSWVTARVSGDVQVGPGGSRWDAAVQQVRDGLSESTQFGPADGASLAAGIAIGDESGQSPELATSMQAAGLSHLTAVSGGNFMIILGAIVWLVRLCRRSIPTQVLAAGVGLVAYAAIVGPQPSVLRAATMAAAGLIGILAGGASRGVAVLAGAVTLLLLISPELAWSLGFALSVVATAALQVIAPPLGRRWATWLPRPIALALAVTISAQAATAPLLLAIDAPVSWVAVPANLVVAPMIAGITLLGVLAALLGAAIGGAAAVVGTPTAWLATSVVLVANWAQRLSSAALGDLMGRALVVLGAAVLLLAVVHRLGGQRLVGPVAVVTCVASLWTLRVSAPDPDWRVIACDVGQGTAVVARSSVGAILLDAGPSGGDVPGCLARAGVDDLAAVVVSHFHIDHVAGLPEVLVSRASDVVVAPAPAAESATRTAVVDLVRGGGVPLSSVAAGQQWTWGDVTATVLWPPAEQRPSVAEANNGSLVVLLEWPDGFRALVPGDIEPESQQSIMRMWSLGELDVAVIPHHASDHQDPRFASWARPAVAIASAGVGNSYGHPAATTLAEYAAIGAVVRRTDEEGAIVVSVTDGHAAVTAWG